MKADRSRRSTGFMTSVYASTAQSPCGATVLRSLTTSASLPSLMEQYASYLLTHSSFFFASSSSLLVIVAMQMLLMLKCFFCFMILVSYITCIIRSVFALI